MSGRPLKLVIAGITVVAGLAVGYFAVAPADMPAADQPAAAAKAQPVPAKEATPQSNSHVRMSNVKLLQPPVKKDFAKVAAPEKDKPDEASDEK